MTAEYVAAILDTWHAASNDERDAGRRWYAQSSEIVTTLAAWSGCEPARVAGAIAALSPRNPWAWNVQDAAAFAWASAHDEPMPSATTFGQNRERAWRILTADAADVWTGTANKVRSFVANMTGDVDAVTVDVWAVRVATRGERDAVASDADYAALREAYRQAAAILGETPRDVQAVTWLHAQAAGTGSRRRGRHDLTAKRGTLEIVAEVLGLPHQRTLGL